MDAGIPSCEAKEDPFEASPEAVAFAASYHGGADPRCELIAEPELAACTIGTGASTIVGIRYRCPNSGRVPELIDGTYLRDCRFAGKARDGEHYTLCCPPACIHTSDGDKSCSPGRRQFACPITSDEPCGASTPGPSCAFMGRTGSIDAFCCD